MTAPADAIELTQTGYGVQISATHGNYITSITVSELDLPRIRDAINAYLAGL